MAGLDGAASPSFLALLAAEGFWPDGRARPPPPLWPPPARSSPSFPSLLSLSPSSVVLLAPYGAQQRHRCESDCWRNAMKQSLNQQQVSKGLEAVTHKLEHVPVKDVVVGETLSVEKIPKELPEIGVVWLVVEAQRATQIQVGGELGCRTQKEVMCKCYIYAGLGTRRQRSCHTHTHQHRDFEKTFSSAISEKVFPTAFKNHLSCARLPRYGNPVGLCIKV